MSTFEQTSDYELKHAVYLKLFTLGALFFLCHEAAGKHIYISIYTYIDAVMSSYLYGIF